MNCDITSFLFKTIPKRPRGLRIKLRIVRTNNSLETFNESTHPAATIMHHGLFLAMPTPNSVKDPMLIAVLNQQRFSNDGFDLKYGVSWTARREDQDSVSEVADKQGSERHLGKRIINHSVETRVRPSEISMRHSISLYRGGIVKDLPQTAAFDQHMDRLLEQYLENYPSKCFCVKSLLGFRFSKFYKSSAPQDHPLKLKDAFEESFLGNPSSLLVASVHSLLESHTLSLDSETRPPQTTIGEKSFVGPLPGGIHALLPDLKIWELLTPFGHYLNSLNSILLHLQEFLPPQSQTHQNEHYQSVITETQESFRRLTYDMVQLCQKPILDVLQSEAEMISCLLKEIEKHPQQHHYMTVQELPFYLGLLYSTKIETSKIEGELPGLEVLPSKKNGGLPLSEKWSPWDLTQATSLKYCLRVPDLRRAFFKRIDEFLKDYELPTVFAKRIVDNLINTDGGNDSSLYWLIEHVLTDGFKRVSDKLLSVLTNQQSFMIRSAKRNDSIYFDPKVEILDEPELIALLVMQGIKIFIVMHKRIPETSFEEAFGLEEIPDRSCMITVVRGDAEIACFTLAPDPNGNNLLGRKSIGMLTYFTGRYFVVAFSPSSNLEQGAFMMIDFTPCLQTIPQAPITAFQRLNHRIPDINQKVESTLSCTNTFLSCLCVKTEARELLFGGSRRFILQSVELRMVYFANPTEIRIACCDEKMTETYLVRSKFERIFWTCKSQICWSQDETTLLYVYLRTGKIDDPKTGTLVMVCLQLSPIRDSFKILISTEYNWAELVGDSLINQEQRLSTLTTRVREYFVMDIVERFGTEENQSQQQKKVLARGLFTLHRGRLHRVPVNGKLLHSFPFHVGNQITYLGYNNSQLSLFHNRRIFQIDKVVSVLHRLDYKPL